ALERLDHLGGIVRAAGRDLRPGPLSARRGERRDLRFVPVGLQGGEEGDRGRPVGRGLEQVVDQPAQLGRRTRRQLGQRPPVVGGRRLVVLRRGRLGPAV